MRLGLFMMPVHPAARSFTDTLAEDTEKSLLADALGFDELWLGEHFSASTEPIPSPLMFFARLLPLTKHVTFGTAVINLPNHHPAIVAAEVAQFDHMSRGRFMLGIGPGGLAPDFELFEVEDGALRGRKFLEAIDFIERIWAQDPPYRPQGRVLDRAHSEGDRAGARFRHHAEAVPAAAAADPYLDFDSRPHRQPARRARAAGASSPATTRRSMQSLRIGRPTAKRAARPAGRRAGKIGASRAT